MRKIIAALFISLGLASAALAQQSVVIPATTNTITIAGTIAGITQIIPAAAGKSIYITAVGLHPASTSVVTLSYGTGTNCGTGTTVIYGPATFQAAENWYQGNGAGAIIVIPKGNALCITVATAAAPGYMSYSQF